MSTQKITPLKNILFLLIGLFAFGVGWGQTLIISEVADPTDTYQARFVELYNATGSSVDLSSGNWYLSRQANGSSWADISLTGTIVSGSTYVIAFNSSDFITAYGFSPEQESGFISGNGDDGYFLYSGGDHSSGTLVDAYGEIDQDGTGEDWEYEDSQAERNSSICNANTTWTLSEWSIIVANVVDMSPGLHTCDCPSSGPTITTSTSSLTGFTYAVGAGPSSSQSFDLSGSSLDGSQVTVTAPTNYEISDDDVTFSSSIIVSYTAPTLNATTIYVRLKAGLSVGLYNGEVITCNDNGSASDVTVTNDGEVTGSSESDIITNGNESATVSSLMNDATITTTADGTEVWQFTIRDGGAGGDTDALATTVNSITINTSAGIGNQINDWSDAILACALFDVDGSTLINNAPVITVNEIQFTGLSYTVPDDSSQTLSLRISIQTSPNDTGGNLDGDDFVFQISQGNVTADAAGSQFAAFPVTQSINDQNVLDVTATELQFTQQPVDVGVGNTMNPNPEVVATDANGNIDLDFNGSVSITSTGTMTGDPIAVSAVSGVATYTGVVHTVIQSAVELTASATGLTGITSNQFDVLMQTSFDAGDLAIIAVNTNYNSSEEEFTFVCFQDLLVGTAIDFTDNGYERQFPNVWGTSEGTIRLTRIGGGTLAEGTTVTVVLTAENGTTNTHFDLFVGGVDELVLGYWSISQQNPTNGTGFNMNASDDIWIMQGGEWLENDTSSNPTWHDDTYTGEILYGWTATGWGVGTETALSELYPGMKCFATDVSGVANNDKVKYTGSLTAATKLEWVARFNDPALWSYYATDGAYDSGGTDFRGTGLVITINPGTFTDGYWTGTDDTDWFNCRNWQTLAIPDETIDVTIPSSAANDAKVDSTTPDSDIYGDLAKTNNLTIENGVSVEVFNNLDVLEVHGNLTIETGASLDLDGTSTTQDGHLYLFGNWQNDAAEADFHEGQSDVYLQGTSPQTVTCNAGTETEKFYNLTIDNATGVTFASGNIHAAGDLTIQTSPPIIITADHYLLAGKNLLNNTSVIIEHEGSLVQTDNSGVNGGTGDYTIHKTTRQYTEYDYTYWSSPVVGETIENVFIANSSVNAVPNSNGTPNSPSNYIFWLDTENFNDGPDLDDYDDEGDDWIQATGTMASGKGYIAMGAGSDFPFNTNFATGLEQSVYFEGMTLNNGIVTYPVELDNDLSDGFDNENLIGNPYASAIDIKELMLANNTIFDGNFYFWTHDSSISNGNPGPWAYNFTNVDYAQALTDGTTFNGIESVGSDGTEAPEFIASGQGFLATVLDGIATNPIDITFSNTMRVTGPNDDFKNATNPEIDRFWLNMTNTNDVFRQILIGFYDTATDGFQYGQDGKRMQCVVDPDFYSIIPDDDRRFAIQNLATFNENKTIDLGLEILTLGNYAIDIDHVEGVFNTQNIYLKDYKTNSLHNLSQSKYVFAVADSELGEINDRFELRFVDEAASIEEDVINSITIYPNPSENIFYISWNGEVNANIKVFDLAGKVIRNINSISNCQLNLTGSAKGVYIVKIEADGYQAIKKIVLK